MIENDRAEKAIAELEQVGHCGNPGDETSLSHSSTKAWIPIVFVPAQFIQHSHGQNY